MTWPVWGSSRSSQVRTANRLDGHSVLVSAYQWLEFELCTPDSRQREW